MSVKQGMSSDVLLDTQLKILIQALQEQKRVVILEHGGKQWRVDLKKMEQKPVVQPFMQIRLRKVRHVYLDHPSS